MTKIPEVFELQILPEPGDKLIDHKREIVGEITRVKGGWVYVDEAFNWCQNNRTQGNHTEVAAEIKYLTLQHERSKHFSNRVWKAENVY